jgi:hypothetical protein
MNRSWHCCFGGNGRAWQGRIRLLSAFKLPVEDLQIHQAESFLEEGGHSAPEQI